MKAPTIRAYRDTPEGRKYIRRELRFLADGRIFSQFHDDGTIDTACTFLAIPEMVDSMKKDGYIVEPTGS